jgi:hypothetical protein
MMIANRDEEIRRRAHQFWESEGRPAGKEAEHWERAARELEEGLAASDPLPQAALKGAE